MKALDWRGWVEPILALIYPDTCQICRLRPATHAEGYVCGACWARADGVRFIQAPYCNRCGLPFEGEITGRFECSNCREMDLPFESARAAVVATDLILDVIHRYKYRRAVWFEPFLADLLIRAARMEIRAHEWDFIIPVPLHWLKRAEREFNQAERLARHLSRSTGVPMRLGCVVRSVNTPTQTNLTRTQRISNTRRAFVLQPGQSLKGDRIILVDDVLTTGATTAACARELLRAGAQQIRVWTVARGV